MIVLHLDKSGTLQAHCGVSIEAAIVVRLPHYPRWRDESDMYTPCPTCDEVYTMTRLAGMPL